MIRQVVTSHDNQLSLLKGCGKSVILWEYTQLTENLFTLLNDCGFYLFKKWNELSVFCVNWGGGGRK